MTAVGVVRESVDGTASKSQQAYAYIRNKITRHEFTPGYRLVLNAIANDLSMSVVPVREALRLLEAENLVTFERNVGARVSMIDDSQYRHSMEALGILEGSATALAARQLSTVDLERARGINAEMAALLDRFDPRRFTALNQEFHTVLFEHCPNLRIRELVHSEWARLGHLRDSTFAFVPSRAPESVAEHEAILNLIERKAPLAQIDKAARAHREATLTAFLDHEHESGHSPQGDTR